MGNIRKYNRNVDKSKGRVLRTASEVRPGHVGGLIRSNLYVADIRAVCEVCSASPPLASAVIFLQRKPAKTSSAAFLSLRPLGEACARAYLRHRAEH